MKKILITGASGFIGSFLVEKALEKGWEVWAGIRKTSSQEYLQDTRIHFINLAYYNKDKLKQQIESHVAEHGKWDYIIHNAGITKSVHKSNFLTVNYRYTVNFAKTLQELKVAPDKFLLMSSLGAICAETEYGKSKYRAEQYIGFRSSIPYIIIRPTGVYGPREKDYYMVLKSVQAGFDLTAGFKPQQLTFIYVTDLVQVVFLALESALIKKTYTVSDGNVYTDSEYTQLVKNALGKKSVLRLKIPLSVLYIVSVISEFFGRMFGKASTLNRDKYKIMKQRDWRCFDQHLIDDLGFQPEYDLEKGLKASIEWYKQNGWL